MPNNVTVVFDADTQRFRANVDAAGQSVSKSADAIAAAKNKILDAFNAQAEAAAKTGISANQLASIQTKAATQMANVTEQNATKINAALDRISEKQKRVAAELGNLKVPEVQETSDISNRQRASALIRGGGVRAAENFATQFSAFNKVAEFTFPILGAVTLGAEAVKMGKELYDAFDVGGTRARQTAQEVQSVTNALRDSSTSLDVQIDKLQQEQAKLEKKPFNGMKLALDEASQASETLQKRLEGLLETELKVISGMSASLPQKLFAGGSDTHEEQVMLQEHNKWVQQAPDIQGQASESVSYGNALKSRLKELQQMRQTNADASDAAALSGQGSAKLTDYHEEIAAIQQLIQWQGQEHTNIQKTIELGKQEASEKAAADKAQAASLQAAASRKQTEAEQKAAEARLKAMEAYVNEWKTLAPVSAKAIYDYWDAQKQAFTEGSSEWDAIVSKQATIAEEGARKAAEAIAKFKETKLKLGEEQAKLPEHPNVSGNTDATGQALSRVTANSKLSADENAAALARARVEIEQTTGQITKLDAEQQLAAIGAKLHASRLADLNAQLEDLKQNSGTYSEILGTFGSNKDQQHAIELQSQIDKESTAATVDTMKSAADQAAETWQGALANANAAWVRDAQNSAKQVVAVFTQAINSLNENLSNLMTGQKANFSEMFRSLGKTVATDGLQHMEAGLLGSFVKKPNADGTDDSKGGIATGLLGKLGLGVSGSKPDGSKSNPLYVTMMPGVGAASTSGGGGLGSFFGGLGKSNNDSGDDSGSGGGFQGFLSGIFGGARAGGGGVDMGKTYLVGEKGPELFTPPSAGSIVPNHALGGQSISYSVQVANGVTPEQMKMHVQQALREYHPKAMAGAVAAVGDARSRSSSR